MFKTISEITEDVEKNLKQYENQIKNSEFESIENIPKPELGEIDEDGNLVSGGWETPSSDKEVHKALNEGLNDIHGLQNSSEHNIHKKVGSGLNKMDDYIDRSYNDVKKALIDVNLLKDRINENYKELYKIIDNSPDLKSKSALTSIKGTHKKVMSVFNQRIEILNNIIKNILNPSKKNIDETIKKYKNLDNLMNLLSEGSYGTEEASDRLAITLNGTSNLLTTMYNVKKALNDTGLTLKEYQNLKNHTELKDKLFKILSKNNSNIIKNKKVNNIFKSFNTLENNFNIRHKISGGSNMSSKNVRSGLMLNNPVGRSVLDEKSSLVKHIENTQITYKYIIESLMRQLNTTFSELNKTISEISPMIGKEIPFNENVKKFVKEYKNISELLNEYNTLYAIVELTDDAHAKEKKSKFLDVIQHIQKSLKPLLSENKKEYFKYINNLLDKILEIIDEYTKTMLNTKKETKEIKKGKGELDIEKLSVNSQMINSSFNTVKESINKLSFYAKTATIYENLKTTKKELETYKSDYEKTLGKSIADKLNDLNDEHTMLKESLKNDQSGKGALINMYNEDKEDENKIKKSTIETIYKYQYESKLGLYKTIEAIDNYLMVFTDAINKNPESVKDMNKILQQTSVISQWFLNKSGDNLLEVFESLPNSQNQINANIDGLKLDINDEDFIPGDIEKSILGDDALQALHRVKNAVESTSVLKNIVSLFVHIGETFGKDKIQNKVFMSPNVMYKNLVKYLWVSAFTMGYGSGGGDYNKVENNFEQGDFDSHFLMKMVVRPVGQLEDSKKSSSIVNARDELLLIKSKIEEMRDTINLYQDNDGIRGYTYLKVIITKFNNRLNDFKKGYEKLIPEISVFESVKYDSKYETTKNSIDSTYNLIDNVTKQLNKKLGISGDIFNTEDFYFILTLKAMVAKIFTVSGTYGLFKNPQSMKYIISNPTRLMLGGSVQMPEIREECMEAYMRIPLLVEFYRNIFENGNKNYREMPGVNSEGETIAFIPEIGSIWSKLIYVIFEKANHIELGIYNSDKIKVVVDEINKIYDVYVKQNGKANALRGMFLGLISEVNRRYGVMKRQDIIEYFKLKKLNDNLDDPRKQPISDSVNFDILEDNNDFEGAAPSNSFLKDSIDSCKSKKNFKTNDWKIISEFRNRIGEQFNENTLNQISNFSFDEQVKYYQSELKKSSSKEKKYDIVLKAIEQANVKNIQKEVSLMFHEMVITPLNVILSLYKESSNFLLNIHKHFKYQISLRNEQNDITNKLLELYKDTVVDNANEGSFLEIFEILYRYSKNSSDLVNLRFVSNDQIALETFKLEECVESVLLNVKSLISKFRNILPKETILKYENVDSEGSVYYLEERFLNQMLKNKHRDNSNKNEMNVLTFNSLYIPLSNIFKITNKVESYELFENIMWNTDEENYTTKVNEFSSLFKAVFRNYNNGWEPVTDELKMSEQIYNVNFTSSTGIVGSFNKLISLYLEKFYDSSINKIYSNLFTTITNDTFNSIIYGQGFKDMGLSGRKSVGMPENNVVLASSLAFAIKTLNTRNVSNKNENKQFLVTNLEEVSPYMIEHYRSDLPIFSRFFQLLISKCILYRHLLENELDMNDSINEDIFINNEPVSFVSDFNVTTTINSTFSDNINVLAYKEILDNVVEGCKAMVKDIDNTMYELKKLDNNVSAPFMELKKDFTSSYFKTCNAIPFTPYSNITNLIGKQEVDLVPRKNNPTSLQRYIYSVKDLLYTDRQVSHTHLLFNNQLLNQYNNITTESHSINVKLMDDVLNSTNTLMKCLVDMTLNKKLFINDENDTIYYEDVEVRDNKIKETFQMDQSTSTVIVNSENMFSNNVKDSMFSYVNSIHSNDLVKVNELQNRNAAILLNIVDLNVVPINVHAMMRDIPLANIYNYAFTFDVFVSKEINEGDLILKLLKNPYDNIENNEEFRNMMVSGQHKYRMYKPKYLSDQVYNKVLNNPSEVVQKRKNSKLIRNMIFIVNLQRVIRMKIRNEMEVINEKIVTDNNILSYKITDYANDEVNIDSEFDFEFEGVN